jgi:2-polyprenyl-3-methyl-5-hydroxy-6-metoxy-1,4-benzoquinol methylase
MTNMAAGDRDFEKICRQAILESSAVRTSFADLELYNNILGHTFHRTVKDVAAISGVVDVLEIGFFTGVVSLTLARMGYKVSGSEVPFVANDPNIRSKLEADHIRVEPWDLSVIPSPFKDNEFDLIVFTEVIEHLPFNCIPLLRELRRILRPNGKVYCATPNLASLKHRLALLRGRDIHNPVSHLVNSMVPNTGASVGLHWREFTRESLDDLFRESGFIRVSHRFISMNPARGGVVKGLAKDVVFGFVPALQDGQVAVFEKREN